MQKSQVVYWPLLIIGSAVIVVLDQLTKAVWWPQLGSALDFGWLSFVHHKNYGISFGIELPSVIASTLIVAFLLLIAWLILRQRYQHWVFPVGLILSFGGGLANLIDRLMLGYVRDFIAVWMLPIFNLADVFIAVGVIFIIIGALKRV